MSKVKRNRRPQGTGSIFKRGNIWKIQYDVNGVRHQESSESTLKADAISLLQIRLGEMAGGKQPVVSHATVKDIVELVYENQKMRGLVDMVTTRSRIDKNLGPKLGSIPARIFGPKHVADYVAARREEGAEPSTINRELTILKRGFKLALRAEPPMVGRVPYIESLTEENAREGFVEPEQYAVLRDALPSRLRDLFIVAYHIGGRKGELLKLRKDQVDLKAGVIRLHGSQTKNGSGRVAPIYGDMREALERALAGEDFRTTSDPNRLFPLSEKLSGWDEAVTAAGMKGLLFHDLRRTAVRNLERAGVPRKVAMSITGHKTEAVYRRYDIVSEKDLKNAGEMLEAYTARVSQAAV